MPSKKIPRVSNNVEFKQGDLKGLNLKQKRFAEYYVILGNRTQAAIKAGYSVKSASSQGSELLNNPTVRAYVGKLINIQDSEIMASVEEAKRRMTLGMRGELTEEVVVMVKKEKIYFDKNGKKVITKVEEPQIVDKKIMVRDQIESTKLFLNIADQISASANKEANTIEDKIVAALNKRAVQTQSTENIQFEEDEEDADNK